MPTTPTAEHLLPVLDLNVGYAKLLVADIPAERFTEMPHGMNHPAFCLGHLALVADAAVKLMGRPDRTDPRPEAEPLFQIGAACRAEADLYPGRDELVSYFLERHAAAAEVLPTVTEETLAAANPAEGRFRQMCPTVGAACVFLLAAHPMTHLGQISAWRRALGLPSVMG